MLHRPGTMMAAVGRSLLVARTMFLGARDKLFLSQDKLFLGQDKLFFGQDKLFFGQNSIFSQMSNGMPNHPLISLQKRHLGFKSGHFGFGPTLFGQ